MLLVGLTGSIGMGKSTTAAMFADAGAAVWDADAAVHALYAPGGAAVAPVEAAFPGVTVAGRVDRTRLSAAVLGDRQKLDKLNGIVWPLLAKGRERFLAEARRRAAPVALFDVPLLFETGGEKGYDAVVVVTAPAEVQRRRVLERPGMSEAKFAAILAAQTPDAEKRARGDFVIDTGSGLAAARAQVAEVMAALQARAEAVHQQRIE